VSKRIFRLFLVLVLFSGIAWQPGRAENYYGMANDYLQYGAGARSLAMGGAYVALADDASAPYWNPAGIAQIEEHQFLSMYAPFFEGTSYSFISYVYPLRGWGNLAISDVFLYSGGYEEVSAGGEVSGGSSSVWKNAVIICYGNRIHRRVFLGASLKLIYERVMKYSGSGQGIDLGILCNPLDRLSIGLAVQNVLQPKVTLREEPDVYRINFKVGLALRTWFNRLTFTADINKLVDENACFSTGLEISPWGEIPSPTLKKVDLRIGINHLQTFTCGIGLKVRFLSLDYAFNTHKLGSLHKFALTLSWGSTGKATAKSMLNSEKHHRPVLGKDRR